MEPKSYCMETRQMTLAGRFAIDLGRPDTYNRLVCVQTPKGAEGQFDSWERGETGWVGQSSSILSQHYCF